MLLVVVRGSLGFGQAITDPSGSSVIADFYGLEKRGKAFSIQQCLNYVGLGVGLVIGGALGPLFGGQGWRVAFFVSIFPGLAVAYMCWRLPEPSRGTADRAHVTRQEEMEVSDEELGPLFPDGVRQFLRDMVVGLRRDMGVILNIPTLRYALVGVSTVGFVVTAVGTWMPSFYQNQLGLSQGKATAVFGLLLVVGGIPGTVSGGWIADRWVHRVLGARVVIPAVCMIVSATLFVLSFTRSRTTSSSFSSCSASWRPRRRCPPCGPGCPTPHPRRCAAPASPPSTWRRWSSARRRRRSSRPPWRVPSARTTARPSSSSCRSPSWGLAASCWRAGTSRRTQPRCSRRSSAPWPRTRPRTRRTPPTVTRRWEGTGGASGET